MLAPLLNSPVRTHRHQASGCRFRFGPLRAPAVPLAWKPRSPERWGDASFYGWSEDKARQYAEPLRADFGAFVRAKEFKLD